MPKKEGKQPAARPSKRARGGAAAAAQRSGRQRELVRLMLQAMRDMNLECVAATHSAENENRASRQNRR